MQAKPDSEAPAQSRLKGFFKRYFIDAMSQMALGLFSSLIIGLIIVWLPPTLVSALAGAVSAFILKMPNNSLGAGMGTSGLVGQFGALASMEGSYPLLSSLGLIALMHLLFPALLVGAISWFFRRKGWFKPGDMKLSLR